MAPASNRLSRAVSSRDSSNGRAQRPVEVHASDDDEEEEEEEEEEEKEREASEASGSDASSVVDGVELLISSSPSTSPTKDVPVADGPPTPSRGRPARSAGQPAPAAGAWLPSSSPLQQVLPSPSYSNELPRKLLSNIFYAD